MINISKIANAVKHDHIFVDVNTDDGYLVIRIEFMKYRFSRHLHLNDLPCLEHEEEFIIYEYNKQIRKYLKRGAYNGNERPSKPRNNSTGTQKLNIQRINRS